MSASDYLEQKILDHIFGLSELVYQSITWYVALSTTAPNEDGTNVSEPSGGNYSRKAFGTASRTGSSVSNQADILFDTATNNWGTISHFALYDASSGGNMLAYGQFSSAKTVESGDTLKIPSGGLVISLD